MKFTYITLALFSLIALGCQGGTGAGAENQGSFGPNTGKSAPAQADAVTEADLGVPIYPGSTPDVTAGGEMKKVGTGFTTAASNRASDDSSDKVLTFYKGKLPAFEAAQNGDVASLKGTGSNGGEVEIGITKNGDHSSISIINTKKN